MKSLIRNKILNEEIPGPTLSRLCKIYGILEDMEGKGDFSTSSKEIGQRLGVASHNIRKDFSYIGEAGKTGSGYNVKKLKDEINQILGFDRDYNACVVGLERLGTAILNFEMPLTDNFKVVAGFDSNINRLETIKTEVPVFPTYEIEEVISRKKIELAVITVAGPSTYEVSKKLINGGIKGIVNFTPHILNFESNHVFVRNIDLIGEFRYLSALFNLKSFNC